MALNRSPANMETGDGGRGGGNYSLCYGLRFPKGVTRGAYLKLCYLVRPRMSVMGGRIRLTRQGRIHVNVADRKQAACGASGVGAKNASRMVRRRTSALHCADQFVSS